MSLSLADVEKIADLARLALTAAEMEAYREKLAAVLDYAERLNELDLTDVAPMTRAIPQHNIMRDDEVQPSLPMEDVLFNAPDMVDNQFLIQTVLDSELPS